MAQRVTLAAGLLLMLALLAAALWPVAWLPNDPFDQDLLNRLAAPSASHWLGTDVLGRCVFSRLVLATRISLGAALGASTAICLIALVWGLMAAGSAGHRRWRIVDTVLMRGADLLLGFPTLVLALAIIGVFGPSLPTVLAALVIAWAPGLARVVRAMALEALARDYVQAARGAGISGLRLVGCHVVPPMLAPLAVLASLETASVLLALSSLGFLGLGAQPPTPEWGAMLSDARPFLQSAPHLLWGPGIAVLLATLACNLLGEGLRTLIDTRRPLRW